MSHPGIYVRGATTALTRRTTMRKAFLGPWHPMVEQFGLWFLAKAQLHSGVAVHAIRCAVSDLHTILGAQLREPCSVGTYPRLGRLQCGVGCRPKLYSGRAVEA